MKSFAGELAIPFDQINDPQRGDYQWGFPDSSAGKESACNAGDLGSIPGSGRPAGEGIGYPLQYFGHLMGRTNSLEKTLMLGKIEGRRRRG